jgi:hypothetical protein
MHLGIIRVSERCRLGIWSLATRLRDGRVGALPAKPLLFSYSPAPWLGTVGADRAAHAAALDAMLQALSVLNTDPGFCDLDLL